MGHPQLLWATCFSISSSSQFHLHSEALLPYTSSKPTLCQFKVILPYPIPTCPHKTPLSSSPVGPLQVLEGAVRSPQSLFFSRLNSPSLSAERCSSSLSIFMTSSGPAPTSLCPYFCWGTQILGEYSRWRLRMKIMVLINMFFVHKLELEESKPCKKKKKSRLQGGTEGRNYRPHLEHLFASRE